MFNLVGCDGPSVVALFPLSFLFLFAVLLSSSFLLLFFLVHFLVDSRASCLYITSVEGSMMGPHGTIC